MKVQTNPAAPATISAEHIKIASSAIVSRATEAPAAAPTPALPAPAENLSRRADATDAADAPTAPTAPPIAASSASSATSATSATSAPSAVTEISVRASKKGSASARPTDGNTAVLNWVDGYVLSKKHGKPFVVVSTRGHREVLAIGSAELNARIRAHFRAEGGKPLKQRDLEELNEEMRSAAEAEGVDLDLYPRVAPLHGGGVEVDLADGKGTTVKLTANGVEVLPGTSGTLFTRSKSVLALPVPAEHGDFTLLAKYVNLDQQAFMLYLAWVAFTIASPKVDATKYVFLVVKGTQGAGKTFVSKITQRLIDPNAVGVQTLPGTARELAIALQTVQLMVVDNLRDLPTALSDTLCIAATGGSVPMRRLYTDDEQKALYLHGAMIFNGIHPFMGQSDFADRCLVLDLVPIPDEKRKSEAQMLEQFELDRPVIQRGLYDLVAGILHAMPDAQVTHSARMLDFCKWLSAMEIALNLDTGTLQQRYVESLKEAQLESLLDNPLAVTIIEFAEGMSSLEWVGTPSEFYEKLTALAGFSSQRSRAWPPTAASLSKRLHGLQAPLLAQGISIESLRGKDRQIVVRKTREASTVVANMTTLKPLSPVDDGAADGPIVPAAY